MSAQCCGSSCKDPGEIAPNYRKQQRHRTRHKATLDLHREHCRVGAQTTREQGPALGRNTIGYSIRSSFLTIRDHAGGMRWHAATRLGRAQLVRMASALPPIISNPDGRLTANSPPTGPTSAIPDPRHRPSGWHLRASPSLGLEVSLPATDATRAMRPARCPIQNRGSRRATTDSFRQAVPSRTAFPRRTEAPPLTPR